MEAAFMNSGRIALVALVAGALRAGAQGPATAARGSVAPDTIIVSAFDLYHGASGVAGQAVTLDHALGGSLVPSHFRVSKFADFHDATWETYQGTAPRWRSPTFEGTCNTTGVARLVAYFQVRAPRPGGQKAAPIYAVSNVVRDTACVVIGG
jgi:hypothetical protein